MEGNLKNATYAGINITIHIIILFSFLSLFFFLYVSKVEEQAFRTEIGTLIDKNMTAILNENKAYTLSTIKSSLPYLKIIQPQTDGMEKASMKQNMLIKFSAGFTVLMLIAISVSIILTLSFDCNKQVPLKKILLENTVTFIFVAILEYIFFTKIAMNYVPAPPTLMLKTILNTFKSSL